MLKWKRRTASDWEHVVCRVSESGWVVISLWAARTHILYPRTLGCRMMFSMEDQHISHCCWSLNWWFTNLSSGIACPREACVFWKWKGRGTIKGIRQKKSRCNASSGQGLTWLFPRQRSSALSGSCWLHCEFYLHSWLRRSIRELK